MQSTFLGNYPNELNSNWSDETQGVTHDTTHWYISQKPRIWKVPVSRDLNQSFNGLLSAEIPQVLKNQSANHFGDLDYFQGELFVPLEGMTIPHVVVFDANTLLAKGWGPLSHQGTNNASWCAVNPVDGLLFSSKSDKVKHLLRYQIVRNATQIQFNFSSTLTLLNEDGQPLQLDGVQGGAFSEKTKLLYISNHKGDARGLNIFDVTSGRRVAHIEVLYRPGFPSEEEIEGITIWDLDAGAAPNIRGQLHLLVLDNDLLSDDIYMKHYHLDIEAKPAAPPQGTPPETCASLLQKWRLVHEDLLASTDINERKTLLKLQGRISNRMERMNCPISTDDI
jgi:hypothetical protein